jgi:hypothetical protein
MAYRFVFCGRPGRPQVDTSPRRPNMSSRDAVQHQRLSTRDEFEDDGDESGQYAVAVAGHSGSGAAGDHRTGSATRSNPARPASASAQKHSAASPTVDMFDDDLLDELEDELGIEVWRCPRCYGYFLECVVVEHRRRRICGIKHSARILLCSVILLIASSKSVCLPFYTHWRNLHSYCRTDLPAPRNTRSGTAAAPP